MTVGPAVAAPEASTARSEASVAIGSAALGPPANSNRICAACSRSVLVSSRNSGCSSATRFTVLARRWISRDIWFTLQQLPDGVKLGFVIVRPLSPDVSYFWVSRSVLGVGIGIEPEFDDAR